MRARVVDEDSAATTKRLGTAEPSRATGAPIYGSTSPSLTPVAPPAVGALQPRALQQHADDHSIAAEGQDCTTASMLPELLNSAIVKAHLHIGDRALNDYDRRGWLNPIRVGRRKLYKAEEVLRLLHEGTPNNAVKP